MIGLYIGLGIVAFLVIGFFVSVPVVSNLCYKKFFARRGVTNDMSDAYYDEFRSDILAMREQFEKRDYKEHTIRAFDGIELYARYYDYGRDRTVILLHGAYSHPLNNFAIMATKFIEWGYNVLMPDMRSHGKSGGDYLTYGLHESEDLLRWISFVTANYPAKIVLYGISMGAASIGFAADRLPTEVCAAVYDCGYTSVGNLMRRLAKLYHAPMPMFKLLGKRCKRELDIDIEQSTLDRLKKTNVPSFFVHGTADAAVPFDDSRESFHACAAPKELILVEGRGHTTATVKGDAPQIIHDFINKYL